MITGCLQTAEDRGAFHLVIALAVAGWPLALHHLIDPQRWFTGDDAALHAAELLGDAEAAARALDRLGVWARRTGNHDQAIDYFTCAADQWALLGNPFRQAESHQPHRPRHLARGQIEQALEMVRSWFRCPTRYRPAHTSEPAPGQHRLLERPSTPQRSRPGSIDSCRTPGMDGLTLIRKQLEQP
ncbi:hypothetical protein [Actinomadura rupiterrae]|uniref:hypothetical protein n=1 Tax=Actinomadura rupiterrae TaxID=559627 RepID=UPI0020A3B233|nr:hypothetical protein [Actinomadura rupiterrae]MCP2337330.1 hypothetical protein [Actinomadura rupiterrae]